MPASSGDPISTAVTNSLAASSKFSSDDNSLDTKLAGSAKRVLLADIKYEQTSSYNNNLLELKSKYIVLKPQSSDNSEIKLKNGLPKVKDTQNDSKPFTLPCGTSKAASSSISVKPSSPSSGLNKSEAVLPLPKKVLFPPEKIQLGWQSKNVPIGSGMVNLGNTCYLNSTLQALFHVPAFVNWLLNDKAHKEKCENMNGLMHTECLICAVLKTLRSSMENSASPNAIRPHLVYNKLKLICKRLMHGHQEDAHEFLRYLIESMDRSYLRIMQANNLDSYSKETTPLSQIFGGYLRTEVRCLECRNISLTFQHFQDLLLDIRQSSTLDEALEAYFSRERLGDGEEAYKCEKCHRRVAATKQFTVEKPPNVLCIQLKRFGVLGGKNSKHIQVQQSLDLTRFCVHRPTQPNSKLSYRLVSLVSHIGSSSNCGHYTAIGLTCSGQFYLFDDSMVRQVSTHAVSGNNTYIIMYELTSPNPSTSGTLNKTASGTCTVTKPSQMSSNSVNGTSSLSTCLSSSLTNGNYTPGKVSQPSTPLKTMLSSPVKPAYSGTPLCTKNGQPSAQTGHKSLVPYSAESSDSESESASAKHKVSLSLTPVKNGFAKENTSSVKFSNCTTSTALPCKTSTVSESASEVVVNGWHVTEVPQRSPADAYYSPPQNWNVIETSETNSRDRSEESSQSKTIPLCNGVNGKDIYRNPLQNGHITTNTTYEESKKVINGGLENGRISNGKHWDGNRNGSNFDLVRNSTQGYGGHVSTWSGGRTQVDQEVENERNQQRKRTLDQMSNDEFDQGKVKKMKSIHANIPYQNNSDGDMNGRRNYIQEHQNHKNNYYNGRSHNFYRMYNNNHYNRTYQNNRNSNYHWRH